MEIIDSKQQPFVQPTTIMGARKVVTITAVEDDDHIADILVDNKSTAAATDSDDTIPGPPTTTTTAKGMTLTSNGELDISQTEHRIKGDGILASRTDLNLPAEEFAAGCNLLQAAASGDLVRMEQLLKIRPNHVNFRDYDRRTALHVAASEGHLVVCKYLIESKGASVNRSDRWGGSPLDDAHRHRHQEVVEYLRQQGALTGNANQVANLITAAAEGDYDEVQTLLSCWGSSRNPAAAGTGTDAGTAATSIASEDSESNLHHSSTDQFSSATDLANRGDYDKRTALHLAAMEGHPSIVRILCEYSANVNAEDRWGNTPLDDALRANNLECAQLLQKFGGKKGTKQMFDVSVDVSRSQRQRENDNLQVSFDELEIIDRIGNGAFGEIFKCKWRGILVAAKCIKSTKIRQQWLEKNALEHVKNSMDNNANGEDSDSEDDDDIDDIDNAIFLADQLEHEAAAKNAGKIQNENNKRKSVNTPDNHGDVSCNTQRSSNKTSSVSNETSKNDEDQDNKDKEEANKDCQQNEKENENNSKNKTDSDSHEKELALADFRQEISVLKSLRHPNIVLLLAYSTTEDYEVMISELMKCSLLDVLKAHIVHGTKMKKKDAVNYATHLAQGMHYLHTCKPPIIHRDLKPANLLIDHAGTLKISDFGLAKIRPDRKKKDSDVFNMTGETGSYRFMAPEVYRHQKYDETVDIYSYAMILFYLLSGKPPFFNDNGLKAVQKAAEEGDRPIIPRSWDQTLQSILTESWDDNPRARPPFNKIVKRLEEYTRQEYGRASSRGHRSSQQVVSQQACCIIL